MTTSITNEHSSLYKSLTLYFRKGDICCVWEMNGDKKGLLYWPKFLLNHSSTSSSSWLGCSTVGHWGSQSLQAGSHAGILSSTVSNRLGTWLYNFLPASAVLPLIYTGASLDWRLGRRSIYNTWLSVLPWMLSCFLCPLMVKFLLDTPCDYNKAEYEWQQVSSGPQNFSHYSYRFHSSFYFQVLL